MILPLFDKRTLTTVPPIWMSRHVRCEIMSTIGARRPETGGILLGPVGSNHITGFHFDASARCSGGTYSPDVTTLKRKLNDEWFPSGIDLKGFVHSHPGCYEQLSHGDMTFINRLLAINPDMTVFAAPLVFPSEYRMRAFVVLARQPHVQYRTELRYF